MAKKGNCTLCGKEITIGLFFGDNEELTVGKDVTVNCCEECAKKYKAFAKSQKETFTTLLENYKWLNRFGCRGFSVEKAYHDFFVSYNEREKRFSDEQAVITGDFFKVSANGVFSWTEMQTGFMGSAMTIDEKADVVRKNVEKGEMHFTKDDISFIKYRLSDSQKIRGTTFYSLEICVNASKEFAYKPCFTKTVVFVEGFFASKKAEEAAYEIVEKFRNAIGFEQPIERVKKFR